MNELHASVQVFDDGRATIHPITAIEVAHAIDLLNHGPVDMAANGAVHALLTRVVQDGILKVEDETDGRFYLALGIARQGPVAGASECAAQP